MNAWTKPSLVTLVASGFFAMGCSSTSGTSKTEAAVTAAPSATTAESAPADRQGAVVDVRVTREGAVYGGQTYRFFTDGLLLRDPQSIERVKPVVRGLLETLQEEAKKRYGDLAKSGERPPALPVRFVVEPDVHPTALGDLAELACTFTGGDFRYAVVKDGAATDAPIGSFSYNQCPGPEMPADWSCAGVQQPNLSVILHARGDEKNDRQPTSMTPIMLPHDPKGAPDWASFEAEAKKIAPDITCIGWFGGGTALRFDELVRGVETVWRLVGRRVTVVYVPFDGPEK